MTRSERVAERAQPSFVVRPASPRDAPSFLELYDTVAREARFIRTERPGRDIGHYRKAFRASVTSERARYLALEGDRVIGEIGIEREEHPVTRHVAIIGMMVAPDRRGAGV